MHENQLIFFMQMVKKIQPKEMCFYSMVINIIFVQLLVLLHFSVFLLHLNVHDFARTAQNFFRIHVLYGTAC